MFLSPSKIFGLIEKVFTGYTSLIPNFILEKIYMIIGAFLSLFIVTVFIILFVKFYLIPKYLNLTKLVKKKKKRKKVKRTKRNNRVGTLNTFVGNKPQI